MAQVDRGEGHPANRATTLPERIAGQPVPEGFRALAEAIRHQRWIPDATGRLVLRCGHPLLALLHTRSPEPSLVPAAALLDADGERIQGGTYRQVEVEVIPGLAGGAWVLLDGGEQVAAGEVLA